MRGTQGQSHRVCRSIASVVGPRLFPATSIHPPAATGRATAAVVHQTPVEDEAGNRRQVGQTAAIRAALCQQQKTENRARKGWSQRGDRAHWAISQPVSSKPVRAATMPASHNGPAARSRPELPGNPRRHGSNRIARSSVPPYCRGLFPISPCLMNDNNQVGIIAAQYLQGTVSKRAGVAATWDCSTLPCLPAFIVRAAAPCCAKMAPAGE